MNKFYTEQLVPQKATLQTKMKKAMLVGSVVITVLLCFISIWTCPLVLAAIALTIMMWNRLDLEYEYTYYKGEMDIDKIMGKEKRKKMFTVNVKDMEILAPTGSTQLQSYENLKTYDCSSNSKKQTYETVITAKGQKIKVILEPCQEILKDMKRRVPKKIVI